MAQEATRLQKLGRQKPSEWLALKVPPKLPKLAECNAPVGAVRSHVECHIVDSSLNPGAAQQAVQEYTQAEARRQRKLDKLAQSREALKMRIHKHIQQHAGTVQAADLKLQARHAKQERLQKFNQHVQDIRSSLKQLPAAKLQVSTAQENGQEAVPSTSASVSLVRPPLITRHAPNRQAPAEIQTAAVPAGLESCASQGWGVGSSASISASARCPSSAPQEVVKARVTDAKQMALEKKLKEKRLSLPALCGCPHGLSPTSAQYPFACAMNCPLYHNTVLYTRLLQNMLQSYDL